MEKIKYFIESEKGKDILTIVIIILVGLVSFELGRLSIQKPLNGIKINSSSQTASAIGQYDSNTANISSNEVNVPEIADITGKEYFGSKRGKKYYTLDCSSGKSIKKENRIYFSTTNEAEQVGYTISTSCN